jgi:hypothetical protein
MPDPDPGPASSLEPAQEPFEVRWRKYLAGIDESVSAAEQYLEIPTGTISSIPDDPDFIATVKTYAVIEPILNDLISARRPRTLGVATPGESFQTFVAGLNISGRVGKVALATGLGLLREDQVHFIQGVALVRNRYAHNVRNMHRSLVDILMEEQNNNGKIVEHLTGVRIKLPAPRLEPMVKLFMYHQLADYLSDALKALKPPPLPTGGLFAGLFGILNQPDEARLPDQIAA